MLVEIRWSRLDVGWMAYGSLDGFLSRECKIAKNEKKKNFRLKQQTKRSSS